jgi:hypothetical protein
MRGAGVWNFIRAGSVGEKFPLPHFAISGLHINPGKMQFLTSIQLLMRRSGGLWLNDSSGQQVVDLAPLDGLIASGGRRVYVLTAALRAAFSDA